MFPTAENVLPLVVILILSFVPAGRDLLAATPHPHRRGPALKLKLRLEVNQFYAGNERIAASPWTFGMNHLILEPVPHIFIFRKDWRNSSVISNVVVELFSATQTRVCATSIIRR